MIINDLANIVNNFIVYLNECGIKFYQILIALFIFNFIVYVITYMINHFE